MSNRVLFVCAANVCRSPFMAATFVEEGSGSVDGTEWAVRSRGISVVRQHPMCRLAASLIDPGTEGAASAASHVSTQIAHADLDEHDLIIAASREERARVARMQPRTRGRTFTLKEAVALGAPPLEEGERRRVLADGRGPATLADYAEILDRRRGRVRMPQQTGPRFPWSAHDDPRDVPDVHHDSTRRHTRVLRESRGLVRDLHDQVSHFLSASA
jgi:protein-tyrosine phosphatase